jgi:hypothetical protein
LLFSFIIQFLHFQKILHILVDEAIRKLDELDIRGKFGSARDESLPQIFSPDVKNR